MKIFSRKQLPVRIICTGLLTATLLFALALQSFKQARFADEVWKQLGLSKEDGNEGISTSFLEGYLYYYGAKNVKNIATGNRAAVVNELGNYAKQYVNSDHFKKEYLQNREDKKPQAPKVAKNIEQVRAEMIAGIEKSLKEMEALVNSENADLRKMAKGSVDMLKAQLKEYKDPNSALIKLMADGEKMNSENGTMQYKDELAAWEAEYPAEPIQLVKTRLQEFLAITADIDFNAELNARRRFLNPEYESKSREWKQAYRAGKAATEAARTFAQQWLKEIK